MSISDIWGVWNGLTFGIPICLETAFNAKQVILSPYIDALGSEGNKCTFCQKLRFGTNEMEIIIYIRYWNLMNK